MSSPFMQLYVADYLGDTQHLTTEQHGAYLLLLMTMWRQGGSLPNDPAILSRIARAGARQWRRISDAVMAFFVVTDDGRITQKRLHEEYRNATVKHQLRASAGSAGGRAKALKNKKAAPSNASVLPKHLPDIINKKEDTPKGVLSDAGASDLAVRGKRSKGDYPPDFDALWSSYPTDRNMSKKAAYGVWRRLGKTEQAEALASCPAFKAFCAADATYRPVHLVRFLREHRFKGFLEAPRGPSPEDFDADGNWLGPRHLRKANGDAAGNHQNHPEPGNAPVLRGRGDVYRTPEGRSGGPLLCDPARDDRMAAMGALFAEEDWPASVGDAGGQGGSRH